MSIRIIHGDCLVELPKLAAAGERFHCAVTDPPYHLQSIHKRFAAKGRDETSERYAAGPYGRHATGFMGQQWDGGDVAARPETWRAVYECLLPGAHLLAFGGTRTAHRMACAIEDAGFEIRDTLMWIFASGFPKSHNLHGDWEGWGTALKPAYEPIIVARKPLDGTVAANVQRHGCGALNIDASRIAADGRPHRVIDPKASANGAVYSGRREAGHGFDGGSRAVGTTDQGRWPANLLHDGSDEVLAAFPDAPGQMAAVRPNSGTGQKTDNVYGSFAANSDATPRGDAGSAARFFYSSKADASDRQGSKHPTVKPTDLMRYLVRLVCPPNGVVLDPFAGTGSTGLAADQLGFDAVLIEQDATYAADARRKIGNDAGLFADFGGAGGSTIPRDTVDQGTGGASHLSTATRRK